jgi:hypothetical protein
MASWRKITVVLIEGVLTALAPQGFASVLWTLIRAEEYVC